MMAPYMSNLVDAAELDGCALMDSRQGLNCIHFNLRSGRNKIGDLEVFFSEAKITFNVIMFSETWFACEEDVFKLTGYKPYFVNRVGKRGGGVSMLISNEIECELLPAFCRATPDFEALVLKSCKYLFCTCYRPPCGDVTLFFSFIDSLLEFANAQNCYIILGGDFNINFLADNRTKMMFESLLSIHCCQNVITSPTRFADGSQTLLDLFIINFEICRIKSGVINYSLSDHLPIFLSVCHGFQMKAQSQTPSFYWQINPRTLSRFRECIAEVNWNEVLCEYNPDIAYDMFVKKFVSLYTSCFPQKTFTRSKKTRKPWVTPELLSLIKKRDRLFRKFVNSKCPEALREFKTHRNRVTKELRTAKNRYHYNLLTSSNQQSGDVWRRLNQMFGKSPEILTKLMNNGVEISGEHLANAFNDHFLSLVSASSGGDYYSFMEPSCQQTVFLEPVSESEIVTTFIGLKNSTCTDIMGLQVKPIKHVIDLIAHVLVHIFNICLSSGVFPRSMQCAKVSVVYKKGDRNSLSNYRPISILPVFSKGLEKIILKRLTSFTDQYDILTPAQYGFRKNRSTELALLAQKEIILENFENKNMVLGVFLDFTKAFDYINHRILLHKLEHYGIRGIALKLISSYLQHRSQCVVIAGHSSSIKPVTLGVPQGSILGPFLFVLYINDIVTLDHSAKYIIYADDTSLFFPGSSAEDLTCHANRTLHLVSTWAAKNELKLNIEKTKAIMFHPRNKVYVLPQIVIDRTEIDVVQNFKSLGVIFSENLSWDVHINDLIKKLSKTIGLMRRYCYTFPKAVNIMLYNGLFSSVLNYGALVWGTTTRENINELQLLQKRAVRIICKAPYLSHTRDMYKQLNIVNVESMYNYRLSRQYRLEGIQANNALKLLAGLEQYTPIYPTRNPEQWKVSRCRTGYGKQMLKFRLPALLNDFLKDHNTNIESISLKDLRNRYV